MICYNCAGRGGSMINFIISLLVGMLPEVIFLTFFIINFKGVKEKKTKLFSLLMIGYILLIMLCRYQLIFYIAYIIYSYLVVKKLYKTHIIDLFMISIAYSYLTLISFLCIKIIGNYWVALVINRVVLFLPLIFKNQIKIAYQKYKNIWNINKNSKIKSITIRNISLLIVNVLIILLNTLTVMALLDYLKTT